MITTMRPGIDICYMFAYIHCIHSVPALCGVQSERGGRVHSLPRSDAVSHSGYSTEVCPEIEAGLYAGNMERR